ncbi:alpha/beta fold hydrolase [Streptomyces sp. NPDC035033]|uniref:thioesterase II family protein n=1 Tax=Streptomyces sp. NPDC035033 TaxID=3155368 RepID=UPI0033F93E28
MSEPRWTTVVRPAAGAPRARVVVLPHSGSGPNTLLPTLRRLPGDHEVVGVTLPGRERRFAESCAGVADDPEGVLRAVLAELEAAPPAPTVLFGHSMGAVFAAALAVEAPGLCRGLVLSAYPGHPAAAERTAEWTDEELLDVVRRGGGTPEEALAEEAVREHVLRVMRCDLTLEQRFAARIAAKRLPVAPTVLGGLTDRIVTPEELDGWASRAPAGTRRRIFPGGHFYLLDPAHADAVAAETAGALGTPADQAGPVGVDGGGRR